jgi:hypothetical protein
MALSGTNFQLTRNGIVKSIDALAGRWQKYGSFNGWR